MFEAKKGHFSFYGPQMSRLLIKTHFGIHYISEKNELTYENWRSRSQSNNKTCFIAWLYCSKDTEPNRTFYQNRTDMKYSITLGWFIDVFSLGLKSQSKIFKSWEGEINEEWDRIKGPKPNEICLKWSKFHPANKPNMTGNFAYQGVKGENFWNEFPRGSVVHVDILFFFFFFFFFIIFCIWGIFSILAESIIPGKPVLVREGSWTSTGATQQSLLFSHFVGLLYFWQDPPFQIIGHLREQSLIKIEWNIW